MTVAYWLSPSSKGKGHLRKGHEVPEGEYRYRFTPSLTSALDGVGGQRHAPAALPPGETQYQLYRSLGGAQGRSGQVWKISPPPWFDPRTLQPTGNHYTNWANNVSFRHWWNMKEGSTPCAVHYLTLNIQRWVLWEPQRVIFCDPAVTISTISTN